MAENFLYDALASFGGGVNSDVAPVLLPRDTASWASNTTMRGGFARPRPALFTRAIFSAVENGYFQGAGYYRPDFGPSQLVAQISGRLFSFAINGNSITTTEITISGDPNEATTGQVWMWQAEKWLIITDGTAKLPIFWDGVTARRSAGPSVLLATADTFNPAAPPAIGETVEVGLTAPWTYGFGQTVLMNGAMYRVESSGSGTTYQVVLTNVAATLGATLPSGSVIEVNPAFVGRTGIGSTIQFGVVPGTNSVQLFFRANPTNLIVGDLVSIEGFAVTWQITANNGFSGGFYQFRAAITPNNISYTGQTVASGALVQKTAASPPNTIIATTTASFNNPPTSGTVTVDVDQQYTGPAGQVVWIGTQQYTIEAGSGGGSPSTLFLINLTDTDGDNYDATEPIYSVPELPAGRMGAYGIGHVAMCLVDGTSYIYGDVVGGPSGSAAYNYRDAVLKTTENDFLVGGGSFRIPNTGEIISSFTIAPVLDASYGQGPLQIGTPTSVYTCAIPTQPSQFADLTNPILTQALIGKGPVSQNGTIIANSDTLFRQVEGFGSLRYARADFETGWGNVPISTEIERALNGEDKTLIPFTSAANFDNRLLATIQLAATGRGISSNGVVALNFDPVSSLRGKAPSIWEGEWEDGNVLQYVTGNFSGVERCFFFAYNATSQNIEIREQLRSDAAEKLDNGTDRISWSVETPCIFKPEDRPPTLPIARLIQGKIQLANIVGTCRFTVSYRPDFSQEWTPWITLDVAQGDGYRTELGLGEPRNVTCQAANNRPMKEGRFFQIRFECLGSATLMGMEFKATPSPNVTFPAPRCNVE